MGPLPFPFFLFLSLFCFSLSFFFLSLFVTHLYINALCLHYETVRIKIKRKVLGHNLTIGAVTRFDYFVEYDKCCFFLSSLISVVVIVLDLFFLGFPYSSECLSCYYLHLVLNLLLFLDIIDDSLVTTIY